MITILPKTRLLLLGGGLVHICLLNKLTRVELDQLKIILVAPFPLVYYLEMAGAYLEGIFTEADIVVDIQELCNRKGIRFIAANPTKIDINGKAVTLEDGRTITFDILSLDLESDGQQVEGVVKFGIPIHYGDNLKKVKQHFTNRSIDHITVVGAGKLGLEVALALRLLLNQQNQNANITLIEAAQSLLPGFDLKVKKIILDELKSRQIQLLLGRKVIRVTGDVLIFNDNSILDYGYLIWTAKSANNLVLNGSGLITDEESRLLVNPTLQAIEGAAIFGCGEIVAIRSLNHPVLEYSPDKEAEILLRNILFMRKGNTLHDYVQTGKYKRVIYLGNKRAVTQKHELVLKGGLGWRSRRAKDKRFIKQFQK